MPRVKEDVCDWLRRELKNGPVEVNKIRFEAKAAGYTRGELREAKRICGVTVDNNWSREHPFTDQWLWSLPEVKHERI